MELKVDSRQPTEQTVGSLEPSHLWVLGLALDDDGSIVGAREAPLQRLGRVRVPRRLPPRPRERVTTGR